VMETVNNDPGINCPNANWNGTSTNYCTGVTGDDTVAHEWGHAYTDYTSNLIYQWQSGALNESFSDIWGEVVDLLNGRGTDAPGGLRTDGNCSIYGVGTPSVDDSYRWLSGEDDPAFGGAIRDMWEPTCYGDPGKVTDTQYWCSAGDFGGVHTNSGVPNHAFALMVDGGTYNGVTVNAIGLTKASHIHWRAQSVYEGSATNFVGHADALEQSCEDLMIAGTDLEGLSTGAPVGPSGEVISAADCAEVAAANTAVEFRTNPDQCSFTTLLDPNAPALCDGFGAVETILLEDWEGGVLPAGWTVGTHDVANAATFDTPDWAVVGGLPAGASGSYAAFVADLIIGDCAADDESGALFMDSPVIIIPATSEVPRVAFDHWVATEFDYDGGNVKYSVNGAPWDLLPASAYEFNPYNDALAAAPGNTNPLASEDAFTGTDGGTVGGSWGQSQVNLFGLAGPGDTVQFRFDFGIDGCNGVVGWYVDDFHTYSCELEDPGANCGNGVLDAGETCDDGNNTPGDGCSDLCLVEDGWECTDPTTGDPNGTNAVGDWSFEAGAPGNPFWTESSTFGGIAGFPFCGPDNGCPAAGVASTGDWAIWIGGLSDGVTSNVNQSVTIAATATDLTVQTLRGLCDDVSDTLHVSLDGSDIGTVICDGTDGDFVEQTFSVAAYADGGTYDLDIGGTVGGTNGTHTNFFVDDVTIYDNVPTTGAPSVCTPTAYVCGDGVLDAGETCDDGNDAPGDGCSDTCQVEDGWECTDPTTGGNAVADGGFEAGPFGGIWTESSTNFGTPICDIGGCGTGTGTGPSEGDFWVWLGGIGAYEEGSVSQSVVIPAGVTEMTFDLEQIICDSAADYMEVTIDGNLEFFSDGASGLCGLLGYTPQSVDITAYADDAAHMIEFRSEIFANNGDGSNFFVDAVFINGGEGGPSECTPVGGGEFACNAGAEGFHAGIPGDWFVIDNEGNGVVWSDIAGAGELGNYTNGSGDAATVSSDAFGTADFDTELVTPVFSLASATAATVDYTANYQNFANEDFLDVDIWDGATWTNLLSWNEDHGGFRAPPGEDVSIDLSAYLGMSGLQLRFRYHDPAPDDWEWYAQIDDVALNCEIPSSLVCNGAVVDFEGGIPGDWAVTDNEGNGVVWTDIASSGETGNYTNGSGDAATVSSDAAGTADFDTELISAPFEIPAGHSAALDYTANYQNFANEDFLDVDIWDGAAWTNLLSWNEDHGGFRAPPGEDVSIDLSAYAGMSGLQLRWRYHDPAPDDWEWYAQVDDVALGCAPATEPDIVVDPTSLASTQEPDVQVVQALDITNNGDGDLVWNIFDSEVFPYLPTARSNYAGASDAVSKAAVERITIGDADLFAAGSGASQRVTPDGVGENPDALMTITHSATQDIVSLNSVSCNDGVSHTDNSYLRAFDLAAFGITNDFDVTEVQFGVETAAAGFGGEQPVHVNLYTMINPADPLTFGNLNFIGNSDVMVPDQDLSLFTVPVAVTAPAGSVLVVEIFTPNGQADGHAFFIGSNPDGQTDAGYIAAADCGLTDVTDLAAIGFGDMHIVMNVTGDTDVAPETCDGSTSLPWVSVAPDNGTTLPTETTTVDVTFDSTGMAPGVYNGALCVESNDPDTPLVEVPVEMVVEVTDVVYLSSNSQGVAGGVEYKDEDIVTYDVATGDWAMYFDGSDMGLKATDIDAMHVVDGVGILMSFEQPIKIPGFGKVDDSDIVMFVATTLGEDTDGTFERVLDGSDVGLRKGGENVDAIGVTPDGRFVVSTLASAKVPMTGGGALRVGDEQLIVFNGTSYGSDTAGDWEMYFDGRDVDLRPEDIWGTWIDADTGEVYLSLQNEFSLPGVSGDELDIFVCDPTSLGDDTECVYGPGLYFDGSETGFGGDRIDAFSIEN
ncbi:MAG: hypothetical protein GY803_10525, partial [Chloroflexi bacterium]|nr:hypothetical protein [Chloroflexota bacterium]